LADVVAEDAGLAQHGELFERGTALANRRSRGSSGLAAAHEQSSRLSKRLTSLCARL
jgi:hypothetical protein